MPKNYSQYIIQSFRGSPEYIDWNIICEEVKKNWKEYSSFKEKYLNFYLSKLVDSNVLIIRKKEGIKNKVKGHSFRLN